MSSSKKTLINVVCSIMVLITNAVINLWLSPFIVTNIGVEANGFVTLANNFVTYAQLIVTALNSMAARFIAIEYVKKNYRRANLYYNSVFWGNLIIVIVLIIPAIVCIFKLENFINIPDNIMWDVKILFAFVFFNFFVTTGLPNWDCGTFVSNRLDRTYIPQMIISIIKCAFIFITFTVLLPKVYYVGIAATIYTILLLICNFINTKQLTPKLKVGLKSKNITCSKIAIKKLVGAGLWNSVSNVGNMLLSGLDLVICNIFLGATQMGVLSLAKIIPNYMQQLSTSIRNAFAPELTINYAKKNKELMYRDINRAMKLTSVIMTIPIAMVIVLGKEFFSLWVPTQDAQLLQILSVLSIYVYMFTSGIQILYNVFQTVNKVKANSIAMLITGIISIGITLYFIKYTDYGLFAVAGVSDTCNLVRNMLFTVPITAKYLGFKWNTFFKQVFQTIFTSLILVIVGFLIRRCFYINSWLMLCVVGVIIGIVFLGINIILILNKEDRKYIFNKIKNKLKK